jgi:hypothetical protein
MADRPQPTTTIYYAYSTVSADGVQRSIARHEENGLAVKLIVPGRSGIYVVFEEDSR